MIVAVFISDRGDLYLPDCVKSFDEHMPYDIWATHVIDDHEHLLGMAGAVKAGFDWADMTLANYVLWVEEDFLFTSPIPLDDMAHILDRNKDLAQVVLKRQPWSDEEKRAGGAINLNPSAYTQCHWSDGDTVLEWVEHETLFSLNPCLIPRRTLELHWTSGSQGVERAITDACLRSRMRFAYYGRIEDEPRCEHVGHTRSAGYRW